MSFENFLALNASAGSGKTFNLAVRFIELILSGANINQILALTFTKKAANEMKERIIKNFLELENNEAQLEKISEDLGLERDQILQIRDKKKDEFLNANLHISTFDSFFNKVLKLFSLNTGLNPNFSISDKILKSQQNFFINEISKDPHASEMLVNFVLNLDSKKKNLLENLDFFIKNNIKIPHFSAATFPNLDRVNKALDDILDFLQKGGFSATAISIFNKPRKISEIMKISVLKEEILAEHRNFKKLYTSDLDDKFIALKDEIKTYLRELENYNLNELGKFLKTYKNAKIKFNKNNSKLTYGDIVMLTYDLLCENKIDKNLLYFRLDSKITHLLIDEFQDTNILQYEIMLPLIEEIVAGYGQNGLGSFFYVGDTKQSIYGFRGGQKELFDLLKRDFPQIKSQSYRSLKLLVEFVNFIFKSKIPNYEDQKCNEKITEIPNSELENNKKYIEENPNFPLFDIKNDYFGYINVVGSDEILKSAFDEVINLQNQGANIDEIAILCWKNDDCEILKDMLKSQNIAVTLNSTKLLTQNPKVVSIIEYAKFALSNKKIHLENIKSLLGKEPKILPLDLSQNALKSVKFIAEILEIDFCDEDILLFLQSVEKYKNLIEYIYSNDETSAFSQVGSGVKLMTVFKSKGLEFNHVIVCDQTAKTGGNDKAHFLTNYDFSKKQWQISYEISKRELVDDDYASFCENLDEIDKKETFNKLYVAFTRAKQSLTIIKRNTPDGNNPSYFTPYTKNDGKDFVEFIDLKPFCYGYIPKSKSSVKICEKKNKIILANVAKQSVLDDTTEKDENGESVFDENGVFQPNLTNQYFGTALHYALEMCEKFDEASLNLALIATKNKFSKFLDEKSFQSIEKRILNLINSSEFAEFISGAKIYKELPFRATNGEFRQIDLFVVKGTEGFIFDYKSAKNSEFFDKNCKQVEFYKNTFKEFYPNLKIRGFIIFLGENRSEFVEI